MHKPHHILVVEDEEDLRDAAVMSLRDFGFLVVEARNASEALQFIRDVPDLDAVFTDIHLGVGPDGWAVAQAFSEARPNKPVIYASGHAPGAAHRVSNSLFFPKPYRLAKVAAALRTVLVAPARYSQTPTASAGARDRRLTRLVYMSHATDLALEPDAVAAVEKLRAQSGRNNTADGLTGALLIGPTYFIQVLEGEHTPLFGALARISHDQRHKEMRIFELALASHRLFGEWAMHVSTAEAVDPVLLWHCVESFRHPSPLAATVLVEALTQSLRTAA